MVRDVVLRDMDKCKLCGGTGKNGDFDCGMCNGSGEE
jgi:DnaJ-class molecular chaperone